MKKLLRLFPLQCFFILLIGCVYDDDSETQNTPPPVSDVKIFDIYKSNSSTDFLVQIEDSSGSTQEVDSDGAANLNGISVRPLQPSLLNSPLLITIDDDASGSVRVNALTPQNISEFTSTGTLQFDLKVNAKNNNSVITLGSISESTAKNVAQIDISSAVRAYKGSDTQRVKIPLVCFSDQGVDFTQSTIPFEINSSNGITFELGNIQVLSNTSDSLDVLLCSDIGIDVNNGETSDVFVVNGSNNLAPELVTWLTDGSSLQLDWGSDNFAINYIEINSGVNGGLIAQTPNGGSERKDISRYIEKGELRFMLNVESYGIHPTKRIQIQMESIVQNANGESVNVISTPHLLPPWFADGEWQQVTIPLKELFTKADGQIDVNALQNVTKLFSIMPEWVGESDSLNGMLLRIASVQLVIP